MSENEIIRALECCTGLRGCSECPRLDDIGPCQDQLLEDALSLIHSYKAENERLQKQLQEGFE